MKRKIILLMLASVCAVLAIHTPDAAGQPSDLVAQAKQAERLCIRKQFTEAEQVYAGLLNGAADAEERFGVRRKLAAVLAAQEDKQPLAKAAVERILSDYASHARLPHAIHEIAESCHKFGKAKKAKDIYAQILGDQPGRSDAIWLVMGQAIADTFAGDEDGAWANTQKLLNEYQDDGRAAESVGQVAWANRKIDDLENARELYQSVLEIWPDNERAIYSQRGVILASLELGDPNAAEAATAKLFADYSEHKDFMSVVSSVASGYRDKQQFKMARQLHKHIVEQYPNSDQAMWAQREVVTMTIYLRDDPNTEAEIEKLLGDFKNHPNIGTVAYEVARKLHYRDVTKAKELYEIARDKSGDGRFEMLAKVTLGSLTLRGGDPNGARVVFDEVLEQYADDPRLPEAASLMAEAYWDQAGVHHSRKEQEVFQAYLQMALAQWEQIGKQMPETEYHTAAAHYFAGECYRLTGDLVKAVERYEELFQRWPDFEKTAQGQFMAARCLETLARQSTPPRAELVEALLIACRRVTDAYAASPAAGPAGRLLKRWERYAAEGRNQ